MPSIYYKLLRQSLKEDGIVYREGLNVTTDSLTTEGFGLGFREDPTLIRWIAPEREFYWIATVELCSDSQVVAMAGTPTLLTDRLRLGPFLRLADYINEDCVPMDVVRENGYALQYVKEESRTPALCLAAVQDRGLALQFVVDQTPAICLAAIRQCYAALKHVRQQTPDLCLAAIQEDAAALEFVREQTPELCMFAVQRDGFALAYVKEQTPALCLAAIQENEEAAQYVRIPFTVQQNE